MNLTTFLIGYGDAHGNGRGIYAIKINHHHMQTRLAYACPMKPGAIITVNNRLYMSYQDENKASGLLCCSLDTNSNLTLLHQQPLPFFITSWSQTNVPEQLLGSSFYDGVDVMFQLDQEVQIKNVVPHVYRPRSADIRQTTTHPHHICTFNDGQNAYSVDMGIDFVSFYSITNHELNLLKNIYIDCPFGSGPRIMRVSSDGRFAYLLHEIANEIAVYDLSDFQCKEIQRLSTVNNPTTATNSAAGCVLTADGKHLLVTNRGENTLVLFSIHPITGLLICTDRQATRLSPRDLYIQNNMVIVAAQAENYLQLFEIDENHHQLTLVNEVANIASPVSFLQ
nr:beta-propeller fold lactonase family protein [uncultured Tolumonas sp.]